MMTAETVKAAWPDNLWYEFLGWHQPFPIVGEGIGEVEPPDMAWFEKLGDGSLVLLRQRQCRRFERLRY